MAAFLKFSHQAFGILPQLCPFLWPGGQAVSSRDQFRRVFPHCIQTSLTSAAYQAERQTVFPYLGLFGAFAVVSACVIHLTYTHVAVTSQRLKPPLSITKTRPQEVGGVNPNNVRRNRVGFSQELPTRWPSDWMDYHILYMLYSAHTNITREGEGCGVQGRSGNKFK